MQTIHPATTAGSRLIANALNRVFSEAPAPVKPAPLPQAAGTRSAQGVPSSVVSLSAESRLMADISSLADRVAKARSQSQERAKTDTPASIQSGVTEQLAASIAASREAAQDTLNSLGSAGGPDADQTANVKPALEAALADETGAASARPAQEASIRPGASGLPSAEVSQENALQNRLKQASAAYAQIAQLQPQPRPASAPQVAPQTASAAAPATDQQSHATESAASPERHAEQHSPTA